MIKIGTNCYLIICDSFCVKNFMKNKKFNEIRAQTYNKYMSVDKGDLRAIGRFHVIFFFSYFRFLIM